MIVDTNALSAIVDGDRAIASAIRKAESLALTPIVLGEYRFGILQSTRKAQHEEWLEENVRFYRLLDMNAETSRQYAHVRFALKNAGRPIPSNDLWIAALCRQHQLPVLSRDAHFDHVPGLRRLTW